MATRNDFKGKVVLVTGSSSGIGEATAIHLASLSAKLTITGRDKNRLEIVAQKCQEASSGVDVLPLIADLNKDDDLKMLVDETIKRFGRLDILVNNAGIYQLCSIQDDQYMQLYDEIFNTNLRSVLALSKICIPHLVKSKGNIVNVSSIASTKPGAINCLYAMSKSALDMFTKCLAVEFGPSGVRVNSINPAAIRTPIFDKVHNGDLNTEKMAQITAQSYPLRRIGEPVDCAKAVAYLASDDASFLTGVTLLVDGGSSFTQIVLPENK